MTGELLVLIFTEAPLRRFSSRQSMENQTRRYLNIPRTSQGIGQEFIHLADLGRDAQINCAVTDFYYQSTFDVGVDLKIES